MTRTRKLILTTLALILGLLMFGCQAQSPAEPAPTDQPAMEDKKPTEEAQAPMEIQNVSIDEITNLTWQWVETIENNPAAQSVVPNPANYTISFWEDGTFSLKADCNNGGGSYTVDGSTLQFGPMMTTMAMCDAESLYDLYMAFMGQVGGFGLRGDQLVLTLKDDAGEMRFENAGPAEKVESPAEPAQYITIEQPTEGAVLDASQPILVSGMGGALFEGNVVVKIVDAAGNELALQPTIIQSPEAGTGGEGPWEVALTISVDAATSGKIVAFATSPKDGSIVAQDEVAVTFQPQAAAEVSLENMAWQLTSLADGSLNSALAIYQVTATFFPEDLRVAGSAGCNRYFGTYQLDGDQLQIPGPLGSTMMMCPDAQMMIEDTYLPTLGLVNSYEIDENNQLNLFDADGNSILVFQVDPYSTTVSFTREELANASFLNEFATAGVVQLSNGEYRAPIVEGSASELVVRLTNFAAFGDLDGDGSEEAAVILVSDAGGSGTFYDLAVVRKQGEALTNVATTQLGDRVQIKNIRTENGEIVVDLLTQGPDDPMCCPTQLTIYHYALQNGALVLVKTEANQ